MATKMKQNWVYLARRVVAPLAHRHRQPASNLCHAFSSFSSPSSITSSFPPSNNKLFVGGLSWSVTEKLLMDAFSSFGEVTEVRIMYDKETGRPRGFGFVYFSKEEEASSAKEAMDGKPFQGRPLRITYAHENVRGAPVVVPRLRTSEEFASAKND